MANTSPADPRANTPQDPVAEALRRMKRRQRRSLIFKLLLLLVAGAIGALFYLQSAHAFRHLYLPLLSARLGTRITADEGTIRLTGRAWLKNVEVLGTDGETAFLADELDARVAPLSLLPGRQPVVREARLSAAQAVVKIAKDGSTNWDFRPRPRRPVVAQVKAAPKAAPKPVQFPQLTLEKLRVEKSKLEVRDSKGLDLTLDELEAAVDDFGRGQTGTFGLHAAGTLERPGILHAFNAGGSGSLSQDAAGREIGLDGALDARVTPGTQSGATSQTVTLKGGLKGKMNAAGRIDQDFTLAAATPRGAAGQFTGNVKWDPASKNRQASISARGVSREFLNPLLAAVGPVQLAQSRLDGKCNLAGAGDVVKIDTVITGRDLSFRIGEQQALTPVVNLDFAQRGELDTVRQLLHLESARLALQEGGQPVLTSELDRPVDFQVGSRAAAAAPGTPAHINTTLRQLPVQTLQPWLLLAGVAAAQDVRGGTLDGRILSVVENAGAAITLDGQLSGSGLLLPKWKNLPLDVTQTLKGRIEKLETVAIESGALSLSNGGRKLADVDVRGRYELTPRAGQATVRVAAPQAMLTARALGLVNEDAARVQQDGRLETAGDVTFAGKGKPLAIKGTAAFGGFVLAGRGGALPLAGKANYRLAAGADRLTFEAAHVEWTAAQGGAPGTLDVTGDWPLAGDKAGRLKLAARGAELAPWLRLTAREGGPAVTSMLLDADQTLESLGKGQRKLTGELRVSRIQSAGAGAETPVALTVRNEIAKLGEQIQKLNVEVTGRLSSGATDKVVLSGTGKWSDGARELKLAGQVDRLNGDAWLPLFGFRTGDDHAPAAPRKTAAAPAPAERLVASAAPMAVSAAPAKPAAASSRRKSSLVVNIDPLTIGRLQYRGCELSKAKGTLRYENGASRLVFDQGAVAGGTIVGNAEYNATSQEPAYAWEVALRQVDISSILKVAHPKLADNFTGRGDLNSRGSGQGFGDAGKRRLQIETGFTVANGEIRHFPFLEALAKQTGVDQFRSIQFTEFTGRTSIAQGVATLKDWYEKGKDQRVSLEGTVTLDGKYDLSFQPSISKAVAGKLGKNDLAQQLLADQHGLIAFPFQVAVSGQGSDYKVGVHTTLTKENRQQLNEGVRNLLQNVIEEKLNKQDKKKHGKDKQAKEPAGEGSGEAGAPGGQSDSKDDTGKASDEGKAQVAPDKDSGGKLSIQDLLGQQLQKRLDKENKKKDKKKKKKSEQAE